MGFSVGIPDVKITAKGSSSYNRDLILARLQKLRKDDADPEVQRERAYLRRLLKKTPD